MGGAKWPSANCSRLTAVEVLDARLEGAKLIKPRVHGDERGFFLESFRLDRLRRRRGHGRVRPGQPFALRRGVVRGMHFQPGQAKLVRCVRGAIFDVIVDIRVGSPTFGQWEGYELDDETHHQLFVPDGFAHGFCVLSEVADVAYKVSELLRPDCRGRVPVRRSGGRDRVADRRSGRWSCPTRDRRAPTLARDRASLPFSLRYA